MVVAVGGLPGTGKTTVARALAPELGPAPGAVVVRSDEIRKRLHGKAPETRLPKWAYGKKGKDKEVAAELGAAIAAVAQAGHAVIADATHLRQEQRVATARAAGRVRFLGVWLAAPLPVLEERVAGRRGDASDADVAVLRQVASVDPGACDWLTADAGIGADPVGTIRNRLRTG